MDCLSIFAQSRAVAPPGLRLRALIRKKYGKLPPKKAEVTPWKRVNVDLIGPYNITPTKNSKKKYEFRAMTMIDPVTGWFEMAPITSPNSDTTQTVLDSYWLA